MLVDFFRGVSLEIEQDNTSWVVMGLDNILFGAASGSYFSCLLVLSDLFVCAVRGKAASWSGQSEVRPAASKFWLLHTGNG